MTSQNGFQTTSEPLTASRSASARSRPSSGCTSTRSSRAWSTTRPSTARTTPSPSTSRCCCRPFGGVPPWAKDRAGNDITSELAPGLQRVDADCSGKPYEEWKADDWPLTHMAQGYDNIWAAGIAFAPPHRDFPARRSPRGTVITPLAAPDRHAVRRAGEGGRRVDRGPDQQGPPARPVEASMARMGAAAWPRPAPACGRDRRPR